MSRVDSYASHPARMSATSPDSDGGAGGNDSTAVGDGDGVRDGLGVGEGVGLAVLGGEDDGGLGVVEVQPTKRTRHASRQTKRINVPLSLAPE